MYEFGSSRRTLNQNGDITVGQSEYVGEGLPEGGQTRWVRTADTLTEITSQGTVVVQRNGSEG